MIPMKKIQTYWRTCRGRLAAKSVMIQRSSNESYTTTGSPKLAVSHKLPKLPWLMKVLNEKAAMRLPSDLRYTPTEELIVWM